MKKMKKVQAFLAALLLSTTSISVCPVFADDIEETIVYDGLEYFMGDSSAILVGSADKTVTSVTIPAEIEGLPVDIDFGNRFSDCPNLKEILVDPENTMLKSLDGVLFTEDLSNLLSYPCARDAVVYAVPDQTMMIGEGAFKNCNVLQEITIPETIKRIEADAFRNSKSLKRFTNPLSSVMHGSAFMGCTSLEELVLAKSEEWASIATINLTDFQNLETFTLPALEVGNYFTIKDCSRLHELVLEPSKESIASIGIINCDKLNSLDFSGVNVEEEISIQDCNALEEIQLPDVKKFVLKECSQITTLDFSDVKDKGDIYVENCSALKEIQLPDVEKLVLKGCPKITALSFGILSPAENIELEMKNSCLQDLYFYNVNQYLGNVQITDSEYVESYRSLADMGITVHCRRANQDMQEMCKEYNIPYTIIEDEVVPGDVRNDGELDITDAVMLNRIAVGVEKSTPSRQMTGDLNGNGKLELTDSMAILRKLVGLDA